MSGTTLSVFTLYADPTAAAAWLEEALGFETVNRWESTEGEVGHAELRLGEAVVIIERAAGGQTASPVVDGCTNRAPVLCLPDADSVDALHERAAAAGGRIVRGPEDTPWGNHRFEVLDPEGHQWSVGCYAPGTQWE